MPRELKVTLRRLWQRPGFALTAILTLALGIGASTAVFSTVNTTLLRPLAFPDAEDIYKLGTAFIDGRWTSGKLTGAYVASVNENAPSVVRAVAVAPSEDLMIREGDVNRPVSRHGVSTGFFDLFGLPMAAGRPPTADEGRVAVISYGLWRDEFGRDPSIVGGALRLGTGAVTVVGVAPPEFDLGDGAELWTTFVVPPAALGHVYEGYLRAAPGTLSERLQDELGAVMAGVVEEHPGVTGRTFVIEPLRAAIVGDLGTILLVVLGGAIFLLVLGCVNVATLMLARGVTRAGETAIRVALGAGRWEVARVFLLEAFILSAAGAALGLLFAFGGVRLLLAFGAEGLPRLEQVPFDRLVLLGAATALAGSTLLVALVPVLRLSNPDLRTLLNESGRSGTSGRGTQRLLSGFVAVEVALAVTLTAGGGWLVRSYQHVAGTDPGFVAEGRLLVEAHLAGSAWVPVMVMVETPDGQPSFQMQTDAGTPQSWRAAVTERLLALESVTAVGSAASFPLRRDRDVGFYVGVPGEPFDEDRQDTAFSRPVGPGFFEAAGITFIAGRDIQEGDPPLTAVVNEAFVRRYFGDRDPLTTPFASGFPTVNFAAPRTVVGVVSDVRYRGLTEPADPAMYSRGAGGYLQTLIVATSLEDPSPVIPTIRDEVAAFDESIPVSVQPVSWLLDDELLHHRLGLLLMLIFATGSLVLAAIGIYGVVAHATARRRREIATRIALGAMPEQVIRHVVLRGATPVLAGILLGVALALAAGALAASQLHGVRGADPTVLLGAALVIGSVALLANLLPAIRVSRLSPMHSLREE